MIKIRDAVIRNNRRERLQVLKEEIAEAEKLNQTNRLCQLYACLHKTEDESV